MKAHVNPNRCKTIGTCVQICPQVFKFATGNKRAYVAVNDIPKQYHTKVREAARACPENAISIKE